MKELNKQEQMSVIGGSVWAAILWTTLFLGYNFKKYCKSSMARYFKLYQVRIK